MLNKKLVVSLVGLCLVTMQPNVWARDDNKKDECDGGQAAAIGALFGAFAGLAAKKNSGEGALIGAIVASLGCVAFDSQTVQAKSNEQVLNEIPSDGGNTIQSPTVVTYTPSINAPNYSPGSNVQVNSLIVVASKTDEILSIKERYIIIDPSNQPKKEFEKEVAVTGGQFANSLSFDLPKGLPKGLYKVKTQLTINGAVVRENELPMRVI